MTLLYTNFKIYLSLYSKVFYGKLYDKTITESRLKINWPVLA